MAALNRRALLRGAATLACIAASGAAVAADAPSPSEYVDGMTRLRYKLLTRARGRGGLYEILPFPGPPSFEERAEELRLKTYWMAAPERIDAIEAELLRRGMVF